MPIIKLPARGRSIPCVVEILAFLTVYIRPNYLDGLNIERLDLKLAFIANIIAKRLSEFRDANAKQ